MIILLVIICFSFAIYQIVNFLKVQAEYKETLRQIHSTAAIRLQKLLDRLQDNLEETKQHKRALLSITDPDMFVRMQKIIEENEKEIRKLQGELTLKQNDHLLKSRKRSCKTS